MNYQQISGFNLSTLTPDNKLNRILTSALGEREIVGVSSDVWLTYWPLEYFGLDRVSIFQASSELDQRRILHQLNHTLVQESLYIEQAGVGYMAKMVLLAESIQERMLYSLFAADETTHLAQLQPYAAESSIGDLSDPFLQLLSELVESSDKSVLLFVLQVVLEGWGLTHYRSLAKGCIYPPLKDLFQSFLQAESRHHGAGVMLFHQADLSSISQCAILECLAAFLQMVRVGPQRVVDAIASTKGHLSRTQRSQILQQLDTVSHSSQRLTLLKSLMLSASPSIVDQLDTQGLFTPLSAEAAASYG